MTTDFSQIESSIVDVKKRDGRITAFNKEKITNAIYKALVANGQPDRKIADEHDLFVEVTSKYEENNYLLHASLAHDSKLHLQKQSCVNTNKIGSMVRLNQRSQYFSRSDTILSRNAALFIF